MQPNEIAVTIIVAIFGSTGFWAIVQKVLENKSASRRMILGLGYDRLVHLCRKYIERGYVTLEELEDLEKYLYTPYREMGGNGTAEMLFNEVKALKKHKEE